MLEFCANCSQQKNVCFFQMDNLETMIKPLIVWYDDFEAN